MAATLKIGMVGLDTSHCPAFTGLLNDPNHEYHVPGGEVIGAYAGGSALFSLSHNRVKGFAEELEKKYGVGMYADIKSLAQDVDAILLESVDGRQHLEQFKELAVGKPVYIDKPLATSLAEAREIVRLAQSTGTPIMSCSSLRYAAGIADLAGPGEQVISCEAFGPAALLDDYPDLFWYGIHSAEMLFARMGPGCRAVRRLYLPDMDVVVGEWQDGRLGVLRGIRFERQFPDYHGEFGCVLHTDAGARCSTARSTPPYYFLLLQQVMSFFQTGVSPVDIRETLDIIAFLEAAEKSKAQGGQAVLM